jgi:hypothetical protein
MNVVFDQIADYQIQFFSVQAPRQAFEISTIPDFASFFPPTNPPAP